MVYRLLVAEHDRRLCGLMEQSKLVHDVWVQTRHDDIPEIAGSNVMLDPGNDVAGRNLLVNRDETDVEPSAGSGDRVANPREFRPIRHGQECLLP